MAELYIWGPPSAQALGLNSWWGGQLFAMLTAFSPPRELALARYNATNGTLMQPRLLDGRFVANVYSSTWRPAVTRVGFPQISPVVWERLLSRIEADSGVLAALFAARLPESLPDLFAAEGEILIPSPAQLRTDCSCGYPEHPCMHQVSLLLRAVLEIETDPLLLLILRGMDRSHLDERLAAARSAQFAALLADEPEPAPPPADPGEPPDFWRSGGGLAVLNLSFAPPHTNGEPVKSLPLPVLPYAGDRTALVKYLSQGYEAITASALALKLRQDEAVRSRRAGRQADDDDGGPEE